MYCRHCYRIVEEGTEICPACGKSLTGTVTDRTKGVVIAIASIFLLVFIFIVCAIPGKEVTKTAVDESPSSVPFEIQIGNKTAKVSSVTFFELYKNHGYTGYVSVRVNRKNLSDDDIYWITKKSQYSFSDLRLNMYVTSDDNNLDSTRLQYVGGVYDDDYMYYAFKTTLQRYSLLGSSFGLQIIYNPDDLEDKEISTYHYFFDITKENYADSIGVLEPTELTTFSKILAGAAS